MRPFRPLLALCLLAALPAAAEDSRRVLHALNRLSYGPRPGDLDRVSKMGVERYIQEQLSPKTIPENPDLLAQLHPLTTQGLDAPSLYLRYGPPAAADAAARKKARKRARLVAQEAAQARLARGLLGARQLEERLVEFWFNHFNVSEKKGMNEIWTSPYERLTIRPRVLGRFRDLLGATAKDPAMLTYLDNAQSAGGPAAEKRQKGLNENYARELMELHTLGVDGGYKQADVVALARIFTGWGIGPGKNGGRGKFLFSPARHDGSAKVFLGRKIKGRGQAEGEEALDILARHPATARFISRKLARHFVSDDPPAALVDRLTQVFQTTDGNIRAVLEALFQSPEFWLSDTRLAKFKTPYEYLVSCLRAAGVSKVNLGPTLHHLRQVGMPLYQCPTPDGYKDSQDAWLSPEALLKRINFSIGLASGRSRLTYDSRQSPDGREPKRLDETTVRDSLGPLFSRATLDAAQQAPPHLRGALLLGSPEMMRR